MRQPRSATYQLRTYRIINMSFLIFSKYFRVNSMVFLCELQFHVVCVFIWTIPLSRG